MNFEPDSAERRLRWMSWGLTGLLTLVGLYWGPSFAAAVLAGGILAAVNVEALARLVRQATSSSPRSASWLAVLGLGLRYLLLGIALFVIFSVWRANVVAVSLGLSAPVAAVFLEWGLFSIRELGSNSNTMR